MRFYRAHSLKDSKDTDAAYVEGEKEMREKKTEERKKDERKRQKRERERTSPRRNLDCLPELNS